MLFGKTNSFMRYLLFLWHMACLIVFNILCELLCSVVFVLILKAFEQFTCAVLTGWISFQVIKTEELYQMSSD